MFKFGPARQTTVHLLTVMGESRCHVVDARRHGTGEGLSTRATRSRLMPTHAEAECLKRTIWNFSTHQKTGLDPMPSPTLQSANGCRPQVMHTAASTGIHPPPKIVLFGDAGLHLRPSSVPASLVPTNQHTSRQPQQGVRGARLCSWPASEPVQLPWLRLMCVGST